MNSTTTLIQLLEKGLPYDSGVAIYAWGKDADAPARIGQTQFEQGGIQDGMDEIINGVRLGDAITRFIDGDEDSREHIVWDDFLEWLGEEGYLDNAYPSDCYAWENRCPVCGHVVFDADMPNGGGAASCLNPGESHDLIWDGNNDEWTVAP